MHQHLRVCLKHPVGIHLILEKKKIFVLKMAITQILVGLVGVSGIGGITITYFNTKIVSPKHVETSSFELWFLCVF